MPSREKKMNSSVHTRKIQLSSHVMQGAVIKDAQGNVQVSLQGPHMV
jgi:hypothetical protein